MKSNFNIDKALARIEKAIGGFRPAAMFELREKGYDSLYEQLVACILSIRTKDEVSAPVAEKLLGRARTPEKMIQFSESDIVEIIVECTFPEQKAANILKLSRKILDEYNGETPSGFEALTSFRGVGPKCANLALAVALDIPAISVDVHVHRITNRWGYVKTNKPEQTMKALEEKLPKKHWIDINRLLVPFGKHICRGKFPRCPTCPVEDMCEKNGV